MATTTTLATNFRQSEVQTPTIVYAMGLLAPPSQAAAATAKASDAAVKALLKWKDSQSASQKGQLLPGDDFLYLYLTLEKIPQKSRTNPFKIPLPHPLLDPSSEFCLIIDDRRQSKLSKEDVKKLVKSQNLPISKVLRLSKLKSNYKPHEAKRKLCESFDAFLVDRSIVHLLPKLLGKLFLKKKKLPLPVDLSHKKLKKQIERISGSGLLYMRTGTGCVVKVAKMWMECEEIVENVVQVIDGVVKVVPKGWRGVRSLHLKFSGSLALPIFQALPDVKLRIEGMKETGAGSVDQVEFGEENQEIKKKNIKNKKKRRIHEVRYMDFGVDGESKKVNDGLKNESDELVGKDEGKSLELVEQAGVIEDESGSEGNGDDDIDGGLRSSGEKRTKVETVKKGSSLRKSDKRRILRRKSRRSMGKGMAINIDYLLQMLNNLVMGSCRLKDKENKEKPECRLST